MNILHSNWLIQMLKKSSSKPQARLLSLFDILNDWTEAPGIDANTINEQLNDQAGTTNADLLKTYLSLEAAKAGAALPEMLATQLHMMAASAIQEKLIGHNQAALQHAKCAAQALVTAQTKKEFHIARSSVYAIAASFVGTLVIAGSLYSLYKPTPKTLPQTAVFSQQPAFTPTASIASPESTAALVSQIEQMRHGNCRLIEAIQLPDKYKEIYFKNIISGQISTNPAEQKLVRELLQQIRCNYTPMLMQKST